MLEYGIEAFTFEVIEEVSDPNKLNAAEKYWQDYFKSQEFGYSMRQEEDMFKPGIIVEHILSKDWLMILEYIPEMDQYLCRTKTLQAIAFYSFELRERG